jgi:hypothetical protein
MWGCSSAGRAPALQAGGHRFDPGQLHQIHLEAAKSRSFVPGTQDFACGLRRPQDGSSSAKFSFLTASRLSPLEGDADLEAGWICRSRDWQIPAGFNRLRAGLPRHSEKVWMFDNKIDWVTHLESRCVRREACVSGQDSEGVYIQGRAQAGASASCLRRPSVQIMKSVFRR